jgi:hypothetical protein
VLLTRLTGEVAVLDGGGEVQVTPAHLDQHASTIDDVLGEVGAAAQAASAVHFDNAAYGLFCQALPAMMEPLKEIIYNALDGTVDNLTQAGFKVRAAADNYRSSDEAAAARFGGGAQ